MNKSKHYILPVILTLVPWWQIGKSTVWLLESRWWGSEPYFNKVMHILFAIES